MGTPGWAVVGMFLLGMAVWANYIYEEARRPMPDDVARIRERMAALEREKAWLVMLLRARTRALSRVVRELEELRATLEEKTHD